MGVSVLILGKSGSGKSTSLRNMEPDQVAILNVAGKPLPFRKKMQMLNHANYGTCQQALKENKRHAYAIDDANYLMAFENFRMAKQQGYSKFTDMAVNFERLLENANNTDDDTVVYFFMHPDYDDAGNMKPKTIGKMLDNQLTVEGMFPIVLLAFHDDAGYHFQTEGDPSTPVKAPMGMFAEPVIDNDLRLVDDAIRDYWGMAPLSTTHAAQGGAAPGGTE